MKIGARIELSRKELNKVLIVLVIIAAMFFWMIDKRPELAEALLRYLMSGDP